MVIKKNLQAINSYNTDKKYQSQLKSTKSSLRKNNSNKKQYKKW